MNAFSVICCIIVGYVCGNFNTAYVVGKCYGVDIREHGSGNPGATNTLRTLGKKAGAIVLLGDFLKVFLPAVIVRFVIFGGREYAPLLCELVGVGGVLGHCYPVTLGFKGGKGIASTAGTMISTDWTYFLFAPIFAAIVLVTGYVSVGSLFVVIIYPLWIAVRYIGNLYYVPMILVGLLFTASGFFTHRANIVRLLNGTENKFGSKAKLSREDREND